MAKKTPKFPTTRAKDPIKILTFIARNVIRKEPKRYDQATWFYKHGVSTMYSNKFYKENQLPPCGTICCVAGAVVTATGNSLDYYTKDGYQHSYKSKAKEILKIEDPFIASELFSGGAIGYLAVSKGMTTCPEQGTQEYAELGIEHIENWMRRHLGYKGPKL